MRAAEPPCLGPRSVEGMARTLEQVIALLEMESIKENPDFAGAIDMIAQQIGYADSTSFRKLMKVARDRCCYEHYFAYLNDTPANTANGINRPNK